MRFHLTFVLAFAFACSSLPGQGDSSPSVTPDIATQRVLQQYGMHSKILRAYSELVDKSARGDGRFRFLLSGDPGIDLLLDRDYWVLVGWMADKSTDVVSFMLNPKDEQSALVITIGKRHDEGPGIDWKREPGFSGFTQSGGILAGRRVTWRHWFDAKHLHGDCKIGLSLDNRMEGDLFEVNVQVTANTELRRKALEDCLFNLRLCKSAKTLEESKNK